MQAETKHVTSSLNSSQEALTVRAPDLSLAFSSDPDPNTAAHLGPDPSRPFEKEMGEGPGQVP